MPSRLLSILVLIPLVLALDFSPQDNAIDANESLSSVSFQSIFHEGARVTFLAREKKKEKRKYSKPMRSCHPLAHEPPKALLHLESIHTPSVPARPRQCGPFTLSVPSCPVVLLSFQSLIPSAFDFLNLPCFFPSQGFT